MKIFSKTYWFSPLNLISKYLLNRQTHILFEIFYEYWFCVSKGGGQYFVFGQYFVWNTLRILVLYKRKYLLFFGQCLHFATNSLPISPCTQSHIPQQLLHILIRPKISRKHKKQRKDYNKGKRVIITFFILPWESHIFPLQTLIFSSLRNATTTLRLRCKGLRLIELGLFVRIKAVSKQCIISNISQSGYI